MVFDLAKTRVSGKPAAGEPARGRVDSPDLHTRGLTVWLTGLSGAGKTTICDAVGHGLLSRNMRVEVLDGDVFRKHLCRDLGFSKADRDENIRRIGFVANLLTRNGVTVLVAAISPYRSVREEMRQMIGSFLEVHVDAPLEICEARDAKGLYKKVRNGEISRFTGIDDPYEPPIASDLRCDTHRESVEESVYKVTMAIVDWFQRH